MRTLLVYDDSGFILTIMKGVPEPREPIGIPSLWIEIPEGKRIQVTDGIGVDVSVTPHQVMLEDVPKSEVQLLQDQLIVQEQAIFELAEILAGTVVE